MFNTRFLIFMALLVVFLTNCAPLVGTPTPPPLKTEEPEIPITGYETVDVDRAEVQVGVGSPIPVYVVATGNLPDTCAQIEYTDIKQDGFSFRITLSAIPSNAEGCVQDTLPFRIAIPLNTVNLPAGSYSVDVNGSRADFKLENANTTFSMPTADAVISRDDVPVDSVTVEIGVGSPIPVHTVVSLSLPNTCAQLGEIRLHREGTIFFVRLIADMAERPGCRADSIPFRLEIPLNMVGLDPKDHTVNVNGTSIDFSWDPARSGSPADSFQLTYIGADGNVWHHRGPGGQPRQITTDATGTASGRNDSPSITYYFPQISTDGEWIAYRRDVGTPVTSGMEFTYGLWVYNLKTDTSKAVLEEIPASFAWKPGTHLLAYGLGVPDGYFPLGGTRPDASLARGVMGFDADTGATTELVKAERGYALYSIQWSPNGRYLGFDELVYYEGRGWFGYYDFDAGKYVAWEEQLGNYVWGTDGSQIIYDRMIYTPTGTEDIFVRPLEANDEKRLTDYAAEAEFAFSPVLSPLDDRVAYLTSLEGPDSQTYRLQVQDLASGKSVTLGSFISMSNLAWSPDGEWLLFSAGPGEDRQLFAIDTSTGKATMLGAGTMLDVAGS